MLQELYIKNFAIIDDLHIFFSGGLTILSGETGAGKSIIINALNFLLGGRATTKLIRTGAKTAEIEGLFQITLTPQNTKAFIKHGIKISEKLLIRRVISRNKRHKNYINGQTATIQALASITENLASISGQRANQGLLKEEQHMLILDQFANLVDLRDEVSRCYHEILPIMRKLDELKALKKRQGEHLELLEFQKQEIEQASIEPDEDVKLEEERIRIKNAQELCQTVHGSIESLYSGHGAVVEQLTEVKKRIEKAGGIDRSLVPYAEDIDSAALHIQDIAEELRSYVDNIQVDKRRLEEIEDRIDTLQRLKRKYGNTLEAVLSYLDSIEGELSDIENISEKIEKTEKRLASLHSKLSELACSLSEKRKKAADILSKKVEKELLSLKMPNTRFKISVETISSDKSTDTFLTTEGGKQICDTGIDRVSFLIAPNVGEVLKSLSAIASGGELSRVVLAIKAILAKTESVETIVFDEVDSGIGGSVAEVVGKKLNLLANHHQIICITHLPQIAKFGNHHFRISKKITNGRTVTAIDPIKEKERTNELARMLGGEKITRATLDHAREMLRNKQ